MMTPMCRAANPEQMGSLFLEAGFLVLVPGSAMNLCPPSWQMTMLPSLAWRCFRITEVVWTVRTQTLRSAPRTARAPQVRLNRRVLNLDIALLPARQCEQINGVAVTPLQNARPRRLGDWPPSPGAPNKNSSHRLVFG